MITCILPFLYIYIFGGMPDMFRVQIPYTSSLSPEISTDSCRVALCASMHVNVDIILCNLYIPCYNSVKSQAI